MLDLGLGQQEPSEAQGLVYVQDEPALEIALPQVFDQPTLTAIQRGRLPNVENLVAHIFRRFQEHPAGGLGTEYQELVAEFQPLFTWATACWDFLLSTEGCRFLPRNGKHKVGVRGDFRAVTDGDYSRMVHAIFRSCVLEFAQTPQAPLLSSWLRERFWPEVLRQYRALDNPPDPKQRVLTAYSYLRCVPYEFLNDYHQDLVYAVTRALPEREWQAIDAYFFHFYTETATAEALACPADESLALLRQALTKLLINHRLVYCLLRQIERY